MKALLIVCALLPLLSACATTETQSPEPTSPVEEVVTVDSLTVFAEGRCKKHDGLRGMEAISSNASSVAKIGGIYVSTSGRTIVIRYECRDGRVYKEVGSGLDAMSIVDVPPRPAEIPEPENEKMF